MIRNEKIKITEDEMDVLGAVYTLIKTGKIPFDALKPLNNYYSHIEKYIKTEKREERQKRLEQLEIVIKNRKEIMKSIKEKIDASLKVRSTYKSELEALETAPTRGSLSTEEKIKDRLYWIFNVEDTLKGYEKDLKVSEASLKEAEDEYKELSKKRFKISSLTIERRTT